MEQQAALSPLRFAPTLSGWQPASAGSSAGLPFPLNQSPRLILSFSATAALAQLAAALSFGEQDHVLMPDYHCGHEVEPFRRRGTRLSTYPLDASLQADPDAIAACFAPDTRAVLLTHYFGWPQLQTPAIRTLCERRNILLIEDCAHAFLGEAEWGPIGSQGHLAVFSLRKFLPLPHGGAWTWQAGLAPAMTASSLQPPPWPGVLAKRLLHYQKWLVNRLRQGDHLTAVLRLPAVLLAQKVLKLAQPLMPTSAYDPDDEGLDFADSILRWQMASALQPWLERFDYQMIRQTRADHVNHIQSAWQADPPRKFEPLLPDLPAGACPLYFPVLCQRRDAALRWLVSQGIYAASWWEKDYAPLATSVTVSSAAWLEKLRRECLILPVHQDISTSQIHGMIDQLRRFS